ncbi:MAG TPA: extracellular solute-binding protein [Clostridiaceae bacterium]|nr:extracellular solute-binding protein [Clostridiaceae bacterium]
MKKASKLLALLISCLLLVSLLGACGGKTGKTEENTGINDQVTNNEVTEKASEETKAPEKVKLRYFTPSPTDKLEYDASIAVWNSKYPHIEVECVVVTGDDLFGKIRTAIAGGEQVDVVQMEGDGFRDKASKLYYKLNEFIEEDGMDYLKEFGGYAKATMVGDDIYGIAKYISPACVYVNLEYLNKAGISLPDENTWTFDDYFDMIKQLTIRDAQGNIEVYGGMHWQFGFTNGMGPITDMACLNGWDIVTEDGKPNIYNPVLKNVIEKYMNAMFVDKTMPTLADINANKLVALFDFCKGKIATIIGATNSALFFDVWKTQGYLTEEKDAKDELKILKLPRFDESSPQNQTTTAVYSYALAATTKHPREAYEFLKWHCTEGLIEGAKVAHRVPAWTGADKDRLINDWRYYTDNDGNLVEGKDRRELYLKVLDQSVTPLFFNHRDKYSYSSMFLDELAKELSIVFAGEKDVDKALSDAQKACEAIYLKENRK